MGCIYSCTTKKQVPNMYLPSAIIVATSNDRNRIKDLCADLFNVHEQPSLPDL